MFDDQILVLLGHNGAGKTTTMSMLTGMLVPTSGTAIINGKDIQRDINGVRSSLGLCPQHNILFDELTVKEHIVFFSRLKGLDSNAVDNEVEKYVKLIHLEPKVHSMSKTLSGGMKRKLSVCIALCGGSKVVLLDEPTSGMDPASRRALWDILREEKKGRTVLLSTHFMDEADILGDRIAIMSNGELKCVGSSYFLKKKFGTGYHLICVKRSTCVTEKITSLLQRYVPDIKVDSDIGTELSYQLSDENSKNFQEMFKELEDQSNQLGVDSYGISLTTMEEVFMRVGSDPKLVNKPVDMNGNGALMDSQDSENGSNVKLHYAEEIPLHSGLLLLNNQIKALFKKKALQNMRSWILTLIQIVIPILFVSITVISQRADSFFTLKSTESGYSINRSNDTLESSTEAASKIDGPNKTNHNGANGSVITMTLKNNHLIVETEERNDMARDARETKMHYSPSEKDGVFVVEVARGADSTGACNGPINKENSVSQPGNSPMISSSPKIAEISSRDDATLLNNEEIQVHQPPQGINDDEILNVDDDGVVSMLSHHLNGDYSMRPICGSTNTGLSQSDLSISDSCGSNQGYCYGSQQPYTVDTQGYQSSSPHLNNDIKPVISPTNSKPIIKSAIYKQESVEPASSYPEDGRPGRLRSDKNISEISKPLKEDVLIEEQRQLGNGEILVENRNENGLKTDGEECDEVNSVTGKVETFSHEPIENGDGYDSLILLLPAPPTVDEMKQLNDITLLENNNMDSLPPPPPPEVIVEGPTNGAS